MGCARRRRANLAVLGLAGCVFTLALIAGTALAAAGQLDTTFSDDGKRTTSFSSSFFDYGRDVEIQPDGRIVVAGASGFQATSDFAVARHNSNGSLDQGFSGNGKQLVGIGSGGDADGAEGVAIQPNGRIVAVGLSDGNFAVVRLRSDGELDTSFSGDGKRTTSFTPAFDAAEDVAIQPDGKIVVVGSTYQGSATGDEFAVVRYTPGGDLDASFSGDGKIRIGFNNGAGFDSARGMAIQPNGRIIVAGLSNQGAAGYDFAVARLRPNGTPDTSFSGDGRRVVTFGSGDDQAEGVAIAGNGRIVLAGHASVNGGDDFAVVRLEADGSLDQTFSGNGKQSTAFGSAADGGADVAVQPNGRIVVAGYSSQSGSGFDFAIARYRVNGNLDTSFSSDGRRLTTFGDGTQANGDQANGVALQANGRIVVAGNASPSGTGLDFAVARYLGG